MKAEYWNNKMMEIPLEKLPPGLFYGKMGICIYYFQLARKTGNQNFQEYAENLLDNLLTQIDKEVTIDFGLGLSGIAWGIIYLIEHSFVDGNIGEILKDIDDKIYHDLVFEWWDKSPRDVNAQIRIGIYLLARVKVTEPSDYRYFIYNRLIIEVINRIEKELRPEDIEEPPFFDLLSYHLPVYLFLLAEIYKRGIYTEKIRHIWEDLSPKVLSAFPVLHSNRLFLLSGMLQVYQCIPFPDWEKHIILLEDNIDFETIINKELRNKQIFIRNGISGCYWLLSRIEKKKANKIFKRNKKNIEDFIYSSIFWEEQSKYDNNLFQYAGILNGLPGIFLTIDFEYYE